MSGRGRNRGLRSKWSEQTLKNAVAAVVAGRMSRQAASRTFSIPRRTLSRYVDNNRINKSTMGRRTTLTVEQEEELSSRIVRLAEVGYPLTSRTIRRYESGTCPEVKQFIVNDYLEKLKEVLLELDLMNSPERIYNVDKKGCRLSLHHQQSVLARKGAKRVHLVAPEHGENVTIDTMAMLGNTTHELEPMDKSVFRSSEHHWDDQVLQYWTKYKDRAITKQRFGEIFSVVWDKSLTPANIKAGFAATGIFPFNSEAIPEVAFAPSVVTQAEEQPREEPIVKPTINERLTSPTAGPSNIRKLKITTTDYSSDSTDDNSEEERIPFLDDSNDDNESMNLLTNQLWKCWRPQKKMSSGGKGNSFNTNMKATTTPKATTAPKATATSKVTTTPKITTTPKATSPKATTKKNDSKNGKQKADNENWFCAFCQLNEIGDMRLCSVCARYIHEDCVGLTKADKGIFICPLCEEIMYRSKY
ncbi:hypothetical protein NQ314_003894, partial [Rhamnusium bicolor]